jgi:hypothetical protein
LHSCSGAANFTDTTFTKQELAMNILHKVKSVKHSVLRMFRSNHQIQSRPQIQHFTILHPLEELSPILTSLTHCSNCPAYNTQHGPHRKCCSSVVVQLLHIKNLFHSRECCFLVCFAVII